MSPRFRFSRLNLLFSPARLRTLALCPDTADGTPTFGSLDATPQTNILIEHEAVDNTTPAFMTRQWLVEFLCDLVEFRKASPWNRGEIVVFVVEAYVVSEEIERAIVGVCLWRWDARVSRVGCGNGGCAEEVVFGDEVAGAWVQGACEERGEEEVDDG